MGFFGVQFRHFSEVAYPSGGLSYCCMNRERVDTHGIFDGCYSLENPDSFFSTLVQIVLLPACLLSCSGNSVSVDEINCKDVG